MPETKETSLKDGEKVGDLTIGVHEDEELRYVWIEDYSGDVAGTLNIEQIDSLISLLQRAKHWMEKGNGST